MQKSLHAPISGVSQSRGSVTLITIAMTTRTRKIATVSAVLKVCVSLLFLIFPPNLRHENIQCAIFQILFSGFFKLIFNQCILMIMKCNRCAIVMCMSYHAWQSEWATVDLVLCVFDNKDD